MKRPQKLAPQPSPNELVPLFEALYIEAEMCDLRYPIQGQTQDKMAWLGYVFPSEAHAERFVREIEAIPDFAHFVSKIIGTTVFVRFLTALEVAAVNESLRVEHENYLALNN